MEDHIFEYRQYFGSLLKQERRSAGFTQVTLAKEMGVSHSNITAMETGKRAVGNKIAEKLADVIRLSGTVKPVFMVLAAATRIKDRLMEVAAKAHPFLIHYVVEHLVAKGFDLDSIVYVQLIRLVGQDTNHRVWEDPKIEEQLTEGIKGYLPGMSGLKKSIFPFLKLTMKDGSKAYCGLVVARA